MKRDRQLSCLISIFNPLLPGKKDGGIDEKGHISTINRKSK